MGRELDNIDLTVSQRKEITALLKRYLPNIEVWAYGSRVKFAAKPSSDLDMAAFASKDQSLAITNLIEAFEESSLPFRVDLFIWDEIPEQFHKNIEAERVVLQRMKKQSDLPDGWEEKTIGEFCPFTYGKNLLKKMRDDTGDVPVFGANGIIGFHAKPYVDQSGIIIGRKGTVGAVTYSPKSFWPIDTTFYVTNDEYRDLRYTFYLLKSIGLEDMNADSAVPGLNRSAAHARRILIPPLPEQKAIAHILGSLEDKIELNRRMNETLEAMAQTLFKSWFVDFDPVIDNALAAGNEIPDPLKERAEIRKALGDAHKPLPEELRNLFPSEFEHTEEMGWIPKGWKISTVGEFLDRVTVKKRYKKNSVSNFGLTPVYEQGANILLGYHNNKAEISAAITDPAFIFGDHTCVMKLSVRSFSVSENVIPLKGKLHNTCWVYYAIKDKQKFEEYRRHWMELIIKQVISPTSNLSDIFAREVSQNIVKQQNIFHQISILSHLRDTLLPKLLSGEIRIPEAEKLIKSMNKNGVNYKR